MRRVGSDEKVLCVNYVGRSYQSISERYLLWQNKDLFKWKLPNLDWSSSLDYKKLFGIHHSGRKFSYICLTMNSAWVNLVPVLAFRFIFIIFLNIQILKHIAMEPWYHVFATKHILYEQLIYIFSYYSFIFCI